MIATEHYSERSSAEPRFSSILDASGGANERAQEPPYFRDLNLDQVVAAVTAGRDEYDLKPFFQAPPATLDAIAYRHEVMRDLEEASIVAPVVTFVSDMRSMRQQLVQAEKLYYPYSKKRWFLHAAGTYCAAVRTLLAGLASLELSSRGLRAVRDYLAAYVAARPFTELATAVRGLEAELAAIRYAVLVHGTGLTVRRAADEPDYSAAVTETFAKFRQGDVKEKHVEFRVTAEMNHVEAKVLEFVALLYPEPFARLDAFVDDNHGYADPTIVRFDREVNFYLAYIDYMSGLRAAGLRFCYPVISATEKTACAVDAFDLALAGKLAAAKEPIVSNDVRVEGAERILLISGPNQGGKTTFARMFGQLHHFGSIGCPVPGERAQLFLFDKLFTQFERVESMETQRGKLQDDLVRVHEILQEATPKSIVILNEVFNSTTLRDATYLAGEVMRRVIALDLLCVYVTFLDELASLSDTIVSMVSTVVEADPSERTYKVVRRPSDGRSHAISIAEKYGVTYDRLKQRLQR